MKIINPDALATARSALCEWCGRYCRRPTERHHIVSRGRCRLDISENLIDLGGAFDCGCHQKYAGKKYEEEMFGRVAFRLGRTMEEVRDEVYRLLKADKGAKS